MLLGIDHIVILVNDLAKASADYTAAGFTVVAGGEHTDGSTHNALVAFADDSYLELIAFKRPNPAHRWWQYQAVGDGLIDFALLPGDITLDIAAARARDLAYEGPFPGGRLRPDGQAISWQIGMPPNHALPFLCGDITPRQLRVPFGYAWQHSNGVTGIANLNVVVADLVQSSAQYQALLGTGPHTAEADKAVFNIGPATITLLQPNPQRDPALTTYLNRRGPGPAELFLQRQGQSQPISMAALL